MILRSLLICSVGIGALSLMTGTFATAIAQKDVATSELGSCAVLFRPAVGRQRHRWDGIHPRRHIRDGLLASLAGPHYPGAEFA